MKRPWAGFGIGWIFAVLVTIIAVLILLHAIAASEILLWGCILLLALAMLL
jgi:heme/copper-type cytochrome/quinol oxidase subunit 4